MEKGHPYGLFEGIPMKYAKEEMKDITPSRSETPLSPQRCETKPVSWA